MKTKDRKINLHKENMQRTAADFMPDNQHMLRVLHERAEHFAKSVILNKKNEDEIAYVRFKLGVNEHYGIPYQYVNEVMHNITPTKVPRAPAFIAGVINRRGAIIAILDLKHYFKIQHNVTDDSSCIIVVADNGMTMGILVDNVIGSNTYETASLSLPIASEGVLKPEYVLGLHQGSITMINVHAILSDPQLQVRK